MHSALEALVVVLIGLGAYAASRYSRPRHIAKFGEPPPRSILKTLGWFFLCWFVLGCLIWVSALWFGIALVTLAALSHMVGVFARTWGGWRHFRDGAILSILIAAPLIIFATGPIEPGEGRVIDSETGRPIEGVQVRLNCQVGIIHGTQTLRNILAVTDGNGTFRFSRSNVRGCGSVSLSVRKDGYVSFFESEISYHTVDGHVLQMTPQAEATMRTLKYWHRAAAGPPQPSSAMERYHRIYPHFINSKHIAGTPREEAFVSENYCALLADLHLQMSPQERIWIAGQKTTVTRQSPPKPVAFDHEGQVVAFCKAAAS